MGGDFLSPHISTEHGHYGMLVAWSFISFLLINVIMLNVLFGIIVDTFGQLRAIEAESKKDISNICYICGLDRQILDRKGNGFANHIATDHDKWNYMKYIVHLKEKDPNAYNGLEHHVVKCINNQDNGWFPVNRALCLMKNGDTMPNDDVETRERREILQRLREVQEELNEMRSNMTHLSAKVNTSISTETSEDKFASIVDSVMQKSRVSNVLQMYLASKKTPKRETE